MGKEEGIHTGPNQGAAPESDIEKVDQPTGQNPTTAQAVGRDQHRELAVLPEGHLENGAGHADVDVAIVEDTNCEIQGDYVASWKRHLMQLCHAGVYLSARCRRKATCSSEAPPRLGLFQKLPPCSVRIEACRDTQRQLNPESPRLRTK
jgi:hypothetical protein